MARQIDADELLHVAQNLQCELYAEDYDEILSFLNLKQLVNELNNREAAVITKDEIKTDVVYWAELRDITQVHPVAFMRKTLVGSNEVCQCYIGKTWKMDLYGKTWRCWTKQPTHDQCLSTKWEDA